MATKKETAAAQAVENAVETVEKTEAMAEAKAEAKDDGMVTIHLFRTTTLRGAGVRGHQRRQLPSSSAAWT